ncbi:Interferon-induced GTP-binding protein Mx2 [Sphaceloma murrayae]|uniref:Interferon-induced GTP-binding protein Mx2 n=1 Tax=Sphaceloma murrayae TaxID=2082308 RepID=A0A2K1R3A5_9PEZI|nr:Interferon-induced GTP-binding protein Mx2 [Sphaceloma murrayae]
MAISDLQSEQYKSLLDVIDRLRLTGVTHYVDLPQIVVCGDQSAGKSSVLEAISGLRFPTRDTLCTRFATEVVLRRDVVTDAKVSVIPGYDRNEEESEQLAAFKYNVDIADPSLSGVIDEAKVIMGLSDTKNFSNDILRVELQGPQQPHLTLVDLPGLYRAGNKEQSAGESRVVRKLVRSYMKKPRSIILAVVSAKVDFALQEVTTYSQELDPEGSRTLGLITKPDTLSRDSEGEAAYIAMAQNKDVVFELGWHVLKNRSFETRDVSTLTRDAQEVDFFNSGAWRSLDPSTVGIRSLVPRLSNILKRQILQNLPDLYHDILSGIEECELRLKQLGDPRTTLQEQRHYLRHVSWRLSALLKAAIDGVYSDSFFGRANSTDGQKKRLRAVIQNSLEDLSERMRTRGHTKDIVDEDATKPGRSWRDTWVSRSEYLESVKSLIRDSRGTELPGTFNPSIIGELFRDQCRPWPNLLKETHDSIVRSVLWTVKTILETIATEDTVDALFAVVACDIDRLGENARSRMNELLQPHLEGHPITYNHYLISNVQKAQSDRRRRGIENALARYFKAPQPEWEVTATDKSRLVDMVQEQEEVDMVQYASQLAVDYMQAYYKVAMKTCVDDFSMHAVEGSLIRGLQSIFDADKVERLTDAEVANLAADKDTIASDRSRNLEKLERLRGAIRELDGFGIKHTRMQRLSAGPVIGDANPGSSSAKGPDDSHSETSGRWVQDTGPMLSPLRTPIVVAELAQQPETDYSWGLGSKKSKRSKRFAANFESV